MQEFIEANLIITRPRNGEEFAPLLEEEEKIGERENPHKRAQKLDEENEIQLKEKLEVLKEKIEGGKCSSSENKKKKKKVEQSHLSTPKSIVVLKIMLSLSYKSARTLDEHGRA